MLAIKQVSKPRSPIFLLTWDFLPHTAVLGHIIREDSASSVNTAITSHSIMHATSAWEYSCSQVAGWCLHWAQRQEKKKRSANRPNWLTYATTALFLVIMNNKTDPQKWLFYITLICPVSALLCGPYRGDQEWLECQLEIRKQEETERHNKVRRKKKKDMRTEEEEKKTWKRYRG